MTRNLKALGLVLAAAFALAAFGAAGASAASFTSETSPTLFEGNQTTANVFTVGNAAVSCPVARFSGTEEGEEAATVRVHPEYEGSGSASCAVSPIGSATVTTTGCDYVISASGSTDIECEAGKEITINGPCTIHVGPQKGLSSLGFTNESGEVTVTANVTGIHVVVTDSLLCTLAGLSPGTRTTGTYTGAVKVAGYVDNNGTTGAQVNVSHDS